MVNEVILIGNLGQDCEIIALPNGGKAVKFSLATSENYKDKSGDWQTVTEWHSVFKVINPDYPAPSYKKGDTVFVNGKIKSKQYEKDGQTRTSVSIIADAVKVITKRDSTNSGASPADAMFPKKNETGTAQRPPSNAAEVEVPDLADDLPF